VPEFHRQHHPCWRQGLPLADLEAASRTRSTRVLPPSDGCRRAHHRPQGLRRPGWRRRFGGDAPAADAGRRPFAAAARGGVARFIGLARGLIFKNFGASALMGHTSHRTCLDFTDSYAGHACVPNGLFGEIISWEGCACSFRLTPLALMCLAQGCSSLTRSNKSG